MSGAALVACSAVALCVGLPIISAAQHLESRHRAEAVADAAALAAADASSGWNSLPPCEAAEAVATAMEARIVKCDLITSTADARIVAEVGGYPIAARGRAHAAAEGVRKSVPGLGQVGQNGWAWPSDQRRLSQGFHDGLAIDLAVTPSGALFAPFDGVIVAAGPDGGGIPPVCQLQAGWWHGPNSTVVIRHETAGRVIFSSHNHIDPASLGALGIAVGVPVVAGQQVAVAGLSGCTSGPHTHFTLSTSARNTDPDLNPFDFIGPP